VRSVVIGVAAVAMVGIAFHTGLGLLSDLLQDAFVARWLEQLRVS